MVSTRNIQRSAWGDSCPPDLGLAASLQMQFASLPFKMIHYTFLSVYGCTVTLHYVTICQIRVMHHLGIADSLLHLRNILSGHSDILAMYYNLSF